MTTHETADVLDPRRFLAQGETAQVWAVDERTGGYRFLPDGEAEDWREETRAYWRCPVPGCVSRAFTTAAYTKKRHHFRHTGASASAHEGESVAHVQAKAMISSWVREVYPETEVCEEQTFGRLRADVGVTWPTGAQVAFEVEYKTTSETDWRTKHVTYESTGTVDQWLFGHNSHHFRRVGADDWVRPQTIPQAIAERGLPVLMVNPWDRTIGTLVVDGHPEDDLWFHPDWVADVGLRLPRGGDLLARVIPCHIDDCRLDPEQGLVTPVMDEIAAARLDRENRAKPLWEAEQARARSEAAEKAAAARAEEKRTARLAEDAERHGRLRAPEGAGSTHGPVLAHCGQCARREVLGLPVTTPSPGYRPWREADGRTIDEPSKRASSLV